MAEKYFVERDPYSPIRYSYEIDQILCEGRSEFQEYMVFTNPFFGRVLVLDGVVQLTERDEFFYHEMLAHVPLQSISEPGEVIIIGGGDGGVAREVIKHPWVTAVTVVDIDPMVARLSKEYFPCVSSALSDRRVTQIAMDGAQFLREYRGQARAILVDSTDIAGNAETLFSESFFRDARGALHPDGVFVTLSESLHFHFSMVRMLQERLARVFGNSDIYTAPIATYAGNWWCFAVGFGARSCREPVGQIAGPTRYYDADVHRASFLAPRLYQRLMESERLGY